MLQNGLYWSFYCSSIWIFVQIVKIHHSHFAQFYKCQGETFRASSRWTNQQLTASNTPEVDHHPTWETKLHLPVPLRGKKESNENSRQIFFFIYHSASESKQSQKKGSVWEGTKKRTLVVSDNVFRCLYMSGYNITPLHLSTLLFSLFSNIYIKESKSIFNSMSQSILSISIQPQRDKHKSNFRTWNSSPFIHISNDCGCQFIQCCQQLRGRCVCGGSRPWHLSRGL